MNTEQIYSQTRILSQAEKVILVDKLLSSIHDVSPKIEKLWGAEAEIRLHNYQQNNNSKIMSEVVAKYK